MILIRGIRLPLSAHRREAVERARRQLGLPRGQIAFADIARVSVDARRRPPMLVYTVAVTLHDAAAEAACAQKPGAALAARQELTVTPGTQPLAHRPVVCGFGPAGLFAALLLARMGYRPLVLERGAPLEQRVRDTAAFSAGGPLDPESNIQFGEGGAGAFSDGKLTTRIGDARCGYVTQALLAHGAPREISVRQKPHLGTDLLRGVIASLRGELLRLGGEVRFHTALTGLAARDGRLCAVRTTAGEIPCEALILAPGHSARDTFAVLAGAGLALTCKPFSVGLRAEHLQADIDRGLYHEAAGHPALPPGEYQLSRHMPDGRCVYTFCMCPGGRVVASASEEGGVVTNGMSFHARDGHNANAAVAVTVDGRDFSDDPWKAVAFQRQLEQAAYRAAGGNYAAPAADLAHFLAQKPGLEIGRVRPTYDRGVQAADLGALFPDALADDLRQGLTAFGRMLPGYDAADTILTGPETRTSSPLRVLRGEDGQATGLRGLYPCGEGAGYAGGIMSAAVDGLRAAEQVICQYKPK